MKKILFVYEFSDLGYEVIEQAGVECLAAYMSSLNWQVDVYNTIYEMDIEKKIIDFHPDIVGVSITTPTVSSTIDLLDGIKKELPETKIVVGGIGASIESQAILEDYPFIDAVLIGEGELTLFETAESLLLNRDLKNIKGLVFRDGNRIIRTPKRDLIDNINELPMPLHIAYEKYKDNKNLKYITLVTTRGCYGNCSFCARNFKNQKGAIVRNRSAHTVIKEIEYCINKFNVRRFAFCDQTFEDACPVGKARINEIADLIIEKQLDIIFTIHIRSENWKKKDIDLIKKLRKAGLVGIYPGVEGADEETLKVYNKYAREEDHITTLKLFSAIDVAIDMGFIMFNPYTKIDSLKSNLAFIRKMKLGNLGHIFFNRLIIFPEVSLLNPMRKDGLILIEPSYKNFFEAQYGYQFMDSHIQYLFENVITPKLEADLCINKLYILSIDWQIFLSIVKLKLENYHFNREIQLLEWEYNRMKDFFHEKYCLIFESLIRAAIEYDDSLVIKEDFNDEYKKFRKNFENYKMRLFKKTVQNNSDFCERYYNY